MIETRLKFDDFKNRLVQTEVNDTELAQWEARLASVLIERWGLVAAMPDGEDNAGRSKLRKLTPEELVNEACDVAALAVARFRERGWVTSMPTFAERDAFAEAAKDDGK